MKVDDISHKDTRVRRINSKLVSFIPLDFYTMQLYISPDAILCREGEMGRYVVPCIVTSWRMVKWKSKDYFKAMLSGQTVTVWSTYIHLFAIFSQYLINYFQSESYSHITDTSLRIDSLLVKLK